MQPIKKILSPLDFSEPSYSALQMANEMALHFGAEITLMHVIPWDPYVVHVNYCPEIVENLRQKAEYELRAAARDYLSIEIPRHVLVKRGNPADEIVMAAKLEESNLIVIATHGLSGWRHLVFGSVAEMVVRLSSCPVLTVHASSTKSRSISDVAQETLAPH